MFKKLLRAVTQFRNRKKDKIATAKILKEYENIKDKNQHKTGKGIKLTLFYMLENNYNIYAVGDYRRADKVHVYNSLKYIANVRALTIEEVIQEYQQQLNIKDLLELIN